MANTFFEFLEEERLRDERRQIEETDKVVTLLKNANQMWAKEQPLTVAVKPTPRAVKKAATEEDVGNGFVFGFLAGAIVMGLFCVVIIAGSLMGWF